jgi:hypothetical protein
MEPPADDPMYKVGSTWHHTYASGHEGRITKVLEIDYMVDVEPPGHGGTRLFTTARSLKDAIDRADRWVEAHSAITDWQAGRA